MFQPVVSSEWAGLVLVMLLWMFIVWLALWALDRLFPQIERSGDERAGSHPNPSPQHLPGHSPGRPPYVTPAAVSPAASVRPLNIPVIPIWLQNYWNTGRKTIGILLAIWATSFILPTTLAFVLHTMNMADGSTLVYLLSAHGPLIVFVGLIGVYAWRMRRLDQHYQCDAPPINDAEQQRRNQLLYRHISFLLFFLLALIVLIALEIFVQPPARLINWILLLLTTGTYGIVGWRTRARTLEDYYVAGRRIPGLFNGLAIGSEWISGAAFVSLAGALWLLGYEGLAYIIGWTGGYVVLTLLIAPHLRKSGQYTVSAFVGTRYEGLPARLTAAFTCIVISFIYMTAQIIGIGIILSYFLGVSYTFGVIIGIGAVLLCSLRGGMQTITWTQSIQGIVLGVAYLLPITWLALRQTGSLLPQFSYPELLQQIELLEAAWHVPHRYTEPFNDWSVWNFVALVICLMLGTASMPHILIRFYSVPSVRESRSSAVWAILFISLIYLTIPAYAIFARWELLQHVVGQPVTELPAWAVSWASTDWLTIADGLEQGGNGDGWVQFGELTIDQDLVVLATPQFAGLPGTIVSLVVVGGLAAALSTASGLLLVIASSAVHDVYYRSIYPRGALRERLWLVRSVVLVVAILVALTALPRMGIIVQMVAWTFSFTAAIFFPILVLGIFWKGANSYGAVAGMLSGATVTTVYLVLNYLNPDFHLLGINHTAAGIFGLPVNCFVTWFVSRLTGPPSPHIQALVDRLRHP